LNRPLRHRLTQSCHSRRGRTCGRPRGHPLIRRPVAGAHTPAVFHQVERGEKRKNKKKRIKTTNQQKRGGGGGLSKVLLSVGSPAAEPRMRKVCLGVSLCLPLLSFHDHRH
jgi:hypothetical protein